MIDYLFLLIFFSFIASSGVYIALMSSYKGETLRFVNFVSKIPDPNWWKILKIIPTALVILGAFLFKNNQINSILFLGIIFALLFCLIGDFTIESSFFQGMVFFSFAQIFFIITFILSFTQHFFTFDNFSMFLLVVFALIITVYQVIFLKFLKQGGKLGKFQSPVRIYSILISIMFMLTCSLVYFMELDDLAFLIPFGALCFILSDSLIAIREFHSIELKNSVAMIMGTYYTAIFFLSFSTAIL